MIKNFKEMTRRDLFGLIFGAAAAKSLPIKDTAKPLGKTLQVDMNLLNTDIYKDLLVKYGNCDYFLASELFKIKEAK